VNSLELTERQADVFMGVLRALRVAAHANDGPAALDTPEADAAFLEEVQTGFNKVFDDELAYRRARLRTPPERGSSS
jgi:hypothetical protein